MGSIPGVFHTQNNGFNWHYYIKYSPIICGLTSNRRKTITKKAMTMIEFIFNIFNAIYCHCYWLFTSTLQLPPDTVVVVVAIVVNVNTYSISHRSWMVTEPLHQSKAWVEPAVLDSCNDCPRCQQKVSITASSTTLSLWCTGLATFQDGARDCKMEYCVTIIAWLPLWLLLVLPLYLSSLLSVLLSLHGLIISI